MKKNRVRAIEPKLEAERAFVDEVERLTEGTVWTAGGCASWYIDETGRNSTLWPRGVGAFRRLSRLRPDDYTPASA